MPANSSDHSLDANAVSVEPPLAKDPVFGGLLATQFLGAFNDNYFKQMVLLKCLSLAAADGSNLQWMAMAAFALPFVMFSGLAGFLSDRWSKRTLIIWCKLLEIIVMAASLLVLISGTDDQTQLRMLIVVLALMGTQSAFFGPSKYGILPELFSGKRLLPVNGAIQMTTFLAIIFGTALAGIALDALDNSLWMCSIVAILIAVVGTFTSLLIRRTPVAKPGLKLEPGNLIIPRDVRVYLRQQPQLLTALLVMSTFWFVGGVAQPAVNALGKMTLQLNATRTSLLAASIGIGIAAGCLTAGLSSSKTKTGGAQWTRRGSWLIVTALVLIAVLGSGVIGKPKASITAPRPAVGDQDKLSADKSNALQVKTAVPPIKESIVNSLVDANVIEWSLRGSMFFLGFAAGVFVLPIQVYIQQTPPADQKGRLIGAMNLMTWIGILMSAGFLILIQKVIAVMAGDTAGQYQHVMFLALAVLMLPIALKYRIPASAAKSVSTT